MTEGRPILIPPVSAPNDRGRSQLRAVLRRCWNVTAVVSRRGTRMAGHAASVALGRSETSGSRFYAAQVRLGLEELGPTFVKLGQLLSTRTDLIPPTLQHELSLLRDHVAAIPTEAVRAELRQSAGSSVSDVFAAFDMTPVACASVGQVHRAVTVDGRQVAVKIRRPGIRSEIEVDIAILAALTRLARVSRTMRRYEPTALLDEFSRLLRAETDFETEADNIDTVRRTFIDDGAVAIPTVVWDLTTESVLVMDWIEGISLTNADGLTEAGVDRTAMARAIIHAYAKMIVRSDRFHADPHPGNLFALPDGVLGMVDFGEVGTVTPATRTALTGLLLAVVTHDRDALADPVLSMSRVCRPVD